MRWRFKGVGRSAGCRIALGFVCVLLAVTACAAASARAAEPSPGWLESLLTRVEAELADDVAALSYVPGALDREWRTFDLDGSAVGALVDLGWVALATIAALAAERATAHGLSRRLRRAMRGRAGPSLVGLLGLVACDVAGFLIFLVVFGALRRHWLAATGVTTGLAGLAGNVLMRWRGVAVVIRALLRPAEPVARLIDLPDDAARSLARFLSLTVLAIVVIVGFSRYGLDDVDSGASHVIGLIDALLVCGLYGLIVFRARTAAESLIRGRRLDGVIATIRGGVARAWVPLALIAVAILLVFFVAGLSTDMLSYYHAVASTLGILFVLLVFDSLTERAWHDAAPEVIAPAGGGGHLVARTCHRMVKAAALLIATLGVVALWVDAAGMHDADASATLRSLAGAASVLFVAYAGWQVAKLAIERHLQPPVAAGLPGEGDEVEIATATRLQTALPFLRAALAITIAVLAVLVILSRLGVDTAPLIAGAGVFGLAISFGSQSLVRDIISGLFFMWDDAFRVGEYIDTGRLRGTVEGMSIRSVKLRHHNGPLHTIPYGQLTSVSNLSRDWVILKFNLRLERGTDIEVVRKTVKQIGIQMQDDPEIASEVLQPLKLQGIVEFADTALVVRLKFTARPIKPSWIQREYLKRIYAVFPDKGIVFASGALTLQSLQGFPSAEGLAGSAPASILSAAPRVA